MAYHWPPIGHVPIELLDTLALKGSLEDVESALDAGPASDLGRIGEWSKSNAKPPNLSFEYLGSKQKWKISILWNNIGKGATVRQILIANATSLLLESWKMREGYCIQ
jgi:hypothetical protein